MSISPWCEQAAGTFHERDELPESVHGQTRESGHQGFAREIGDLSLGPEYISALVQLDQYGIESLGSEVELGGKCRRNIEARQRHAALPVEMDGLQ